MNDIYFLIHIIYGYGMTTHEQALDEEQITEIRWKWIYMTSNQNGLAEEYGISIDKLWEVIGNAWSWCNKFTREEHHRLYIKFVGPLGLSCPCCGPNAEFLRRLKLV